MTELKPCPFCGTRLVRSETFSTRMADYFVHEVEDDVESCILFNVSVEVRLDGRPSDRAEAWNKRAESREVASKQPQPETLENSK